MKPNRLLNGVGAQKSRAEVVTIFSGENSISNSSLAASTASRNGCQTCCAWLRLSPWKTIAIFNTLSRRRRICSPQCGFIRLVP